MDAADVSRAVAAATSIAEGFDLAVDAVSILHNSNKLALRLLPCDAFARVAHVGREVAELEVEIARQLAESRSPVAALEPRVAPRPHERDGFVVTFWTYHEPMDDRDVSPTDCANALARLHRGMRDIDVVTPHFTDRVEEAQHVVANRELSPELAGDDRQDLGQRLARLRRAIVDRGAHEQLLHGEPHPGNVVATEHGPLFVDLETCCRGPLEFDLAHVPAEVSLRYPDVNRDLLDDCRGLVLAMVAAWRWERGDQFPDGREAGRRVLAALHEGPPWPPLDVVMRD